MKGIFQKQSFKVGTLILLVFLLIYLPSLIYILYNDSSDTDILKNGKIEQLLNTDGVFIRNEQVINSPETGDCVMDAEEGEKVPASYRIAAVVKNDSVAEYEKLKSKELEIIKAQAAQKENASLFSGDINKLDNEIIEKATTLAERSNRGSLIDSSDIINKIDNIIYRKSGVFGDSSKSATYINKLKNEKAAIVSKLNNNIREIRTSSAGLISFAVDGYESSLTLDSINTITPKYLEKVTSKGTNRDFNVIDADKGKPIAKLVKDLDSYFVAAIDSKSSEGLKLGESVTIRINDTGLCINAVVKFCSSINDGKRIIALKFDTCLNETIGLRRINADIILSSSSGIKVPIGSLKNINTKNKTAEIILVNGITALKKEVKILGMNEDAAILNDSIEGESSILYKTYILNPKNIQEGQVIE